DAGAGNSGGGTVDAGTSSGGPVDAGTTSGGTPDAGSTSGSGTGTSDAGSGTTATNGHGGADAGTTVSDCDGLAPTTLGTMRSYSVAYDAQVGACGDASGSGTGTVALMYASGGHPSWAMISSSGGLKGFAGLWRGTVWPQPRDFL